MAARKPIDLRAAKKLSRGLSGPGLRLNDPGPEKHSPSFTYRFAYSVLFRGRSRQLVKLALVFHVDLFGIACHFRYCETVCQSVQ